MEIMFMSASVVVAIVLCIVGIVKLPFKKFKEKHPQWYRAIFTLFSIALSIGLCIVDELYIICGEIVSLDFAILVCVVLAGVFCGYNGVYEGLNIKELFKKLVENIKKAKELSKDKKFIKYLDKIDDVDKAITYLESKKNNQNGEV